MDKNNIQRKIKKKKKKAKCQRTTQYFLNAYTIFTKGTTASTLKINCSKQNPAEVSILSIAIQSFQTRVSQTCFLSHTFPSLLYKEYPQSLFSFVIIPTLPGWRISMHLRL
jgi:hypothetical protein